MSNRTFTSFKLEGEVSCLSIVQTGNTKAENCFSQASNQSGIPELKLIKKNFNCTIRTCLVQIGLLN